jgi:phenylpropionate dioxygenase-like ring-hydroxylating dioxygenase large terminal subunit
MNTFTDLRHAERITTVKPLPAWAYLSPELLELEYERVILPSWQFVCHQNEVPAAGDYVTLDLWRDSVIVMRGSDGRLRAFQNACRHRGARLLDGNGHCARQITCPYHAWSYELEGQLARVPAERTFQSLDKLSLGLREFELETFLGLVFVRIAGGGPSLNSVLGELAGELAPFGIEDMVPAAAARPVEQWNCNWKVALDNYLDNYHVPYGHPGLHRLMDNDLACTINTHGVSWSRSTIRERASPNWSERAYQGLARRAFSDLPPSIRSTWMFCFMPVNIGFDVYPDGMNIFQVLPTGPATTEVRLPLYHRRDASRETRGVRYLARRINAQINHEDKLLCERVQGGLAGHGYAAGPLSDWEMPVKDMHDRLRSACPVLDCLQRPAEGSLRSINERMLADQAASARDRSAEKSAITRSGEQDSIGSPML